MKWNRVIHGLNSIFGKNNYPVCVLKAKNILFCFCLVWTEDSQELNVPHLDVSY